MIIAGMMSVNFIPLLVLMYLKIVRKRQAGKQGRPETGKAEAKKYFHCGGKREAKNI